MAHSGGFEPPTARFVAEYTETLVDYATSQARIGEPMTLDALSELMDDQQPRAFYDYIRNKDYGLSPEIPADKRTLNQFRRFTGRADLRPIG